LTTADGNFQTYMNNFTTPPPVLQGWDLQMIERRSWASLWRAVNYDLGADYFLVFVERSPASLHLFGRRRIWAFNNRRDATRKLAEVIGT
jgi:hypothetical protein